MAVRVQCPHCQSVCQVDEQHLGATLKCGKCGQAFAVRTPVGQQGVPAKGGFWSRLFGGGAPQPAAVAVDEEEPSLELDGPMALTPPAPEPTGQPASGGQWVTLAPIGICRLDIGAATHPGKVRTRNEDSFLIQQLTWSNLDQRHEVAVLAVADGLGGHEAGDQASGMAIRGIGNAMCTLLAGAVTGQLQDAAPAALAETLDAAVKEANRNVFRKSQAEPGCRGMGSTLAAVLVWDSQVFISHVGDCRVYYVRGDKATQVTRDQTLVARMVELGQLTPAEALTHPNRNEVSQAMGQRPEIEPAHYQFKVLLGDWMIIACDGLHAHVDTKALEQTIRDAPPSAALLANQLVDLANQGGGSDNCTVIAVRCY